MELPDDLTAGNGAGTKHLQPHTFEDQFLVEVDEVADDHLQVVKHTLDGLQVRRVWWQPDDGMTLFSRNSSPAASWIGALSNRRTQLGAWRCLGTPGE